MFDRDRLRADRMHARRHQTSDFLSATSDGDLLAGSDTLEQFRQAYGCITGQSVSSGLGLLT
jgi:hypothetical protein